MRPTRVMLSLFALCLLPLAARAYDPPTLEDLRKENEELRKVLAQQQLLSQMLTQIQALSDRVKRLEDDLAAVRKTQRSFAEGPPAQQPQMGTIRLQNRLGVAATIIVNGTPYRLDAYQTRDLTATPGDFTFEVLADGHGILQPSSSRKLTAGQVYTIFTFQP